MEFLSLSDRVRVVPVIHGSGDCAVEVRRQLLETEYDCLAVPLPPSFDVVCEAVETLPTLGIVIQRETQPWSDDEHTVSSYVPIDPCQPVIAAIRSALGERKRVAFVDAETVPFEELPSFLPDPFALKQLSLETFSAAMLPVFSEPLSPQQKYRCAAMAKRLRELEQKHDSVLFVVGLNDWPWVVDAYLSDTQPESWQGRLEAWLEEFALELDLDLTDAAADSEWFDVERNGVMFLTEELPYIVGRYEQARADLGDDERMTVDGLKDLLIATRRRYLDELGRGIQGPSPQAFEVYLKYVRNLSLVERRLTPDLYTLVTAAQQIMGDTFARCLIELAREYPFYSEPFDSEDGPRTIQMGIDAGVLPDGTLTELKNRLPGPAKTWRTCHLNPTPSQKDRQSWQMRWNPFRQCSWPPEDTAIERFRTHVKEHALNLLGTDLAKTEKFTTSLKDGLDIRETLRNWHTGDLYVKEMPPTVGTLDCVVMLFDSPADPRDYPYRLTWHAEHHDESTLGFFASDPQDDVVGPGIARAEYGGALFLFPPRPVPEIWRDPRLDFTDTLEERLLAAGCLHTTEKHIALLAPGPPGRTWKQLAKKFGRKIIHVPLSRFSQLAVSQLRQFHVLNGHEVRSYAADFIRKA